MTKGNKKTLKNDEINVLDMFWELNKNAKCQKSENQVRTHEQMINLAKKILDCQLVLDDYKYFKYIKSFAGGQVITNTYGKKLYVKKDVFDYVPNHHQIGEEELSIVEINDLDEESNQNDWVDKDYKMITQDNIDQYDALCEINEKDNEKGTSQKSGQGGQ